ncbi:hypothetical protein APA_4225 [Pseudanabaena sp. lw0831]|nr:hypothetical protein APA_4225 [Pseudanabaena sp. lw0831]
MIEYGLATRIIAKALKADVAKRSPDIAIANLYHYFQIDMFYSDRNSLVQINEFNLDLPS